MIGDLQRGTAETRKRVAVYCLKDALLPLRLFDKLLCMPNFVEMARVTGTPLTYLLTRGQQIKVVSQLYRKCKEMNYVIPANRGQPSEDKYEGATVLEPKKDVYYKPIATLDFASLYPSIMIAHNLCYSTLVPPNYLNDLPSKDMVQVTPTGDYFLKSNVRQGVLPKILEELLTARKRAKKAMAEATDPMTQSVLNGRQLALKISANSVYGFTGAQQGQMAALEISSSVTGYGRQMIERTKELVESKYNKKSGFMHDADVVYGDTDSVMVRFGVDDLAEAMRLGKEAADIISEEFLKPIKLEFEKCYYPFLLMNKKRYAGLLWTNPDQHDKLDCKGIETVRRDNCSLVQSLVDSVLNKILIDRSVEGAVSHAKKVISELLQNNVDLSLLVITKSLGKGASAEDYSARQAHVELAERMKKRDPGTAPAAGDRVSYVIIKGAKDARAYEKAEDPLYVLEKNLAIDAHHYLEHQLKLPLQRIFEPILDNTKSLFEGDHTRKVTVPTPTTGGLAKFTQKVLTCLGCKAVSKDGAFCERCLKQNKAPKIVFEKYEMMRKKQNEFSTLWTECQRCQGSILQDVICTSRDCPIFYRRQKIRLDTKNIQETLGRLKIEW
eukprot:GHVL01033474.1.p1 GENE.GHVL01033474.1~~GHVL01033474.1.p1  ORF type:complete len:611 (+),score=103.67 GHVL01033474.1:1405-3237(+)